MPFLRVNATRVRLALSSGTCSTKKRHRSFLGNVRRTISASAKRMMACLQRGIFFQGTLRRASSAHRRAFSASEVRGFGCPCWSGRVYRPVFPGSQQRVLVLCASYCFFVSSTGSAPAAEHFFFGASWPGLRIGRTFSVIATIFNSNLIQSRFPTSTLK